MSPLLLGPVLELGKTLLDRFGPEDKAARMAADVEFMRMAAQGELAQVIAQLEINAEEAQHASVWVAGWRPFFGWIGGVSFAYAVILRPMLVWYSNIYSIPVPPEVDTEIMMVVITGMLGIGGLRTFEKIKQVTK